MIASFDSPNACSSATSAAHCTQRQLQCRAVNLWQSVRQGTTCRDVGRRLAISSRTLRRWRRCAAEDSPGREPGRPRFRLDRDLRREIRQSIKQLGTRSGVATFKARFPQVPCRTLAAVKHHYRYVLARWRRRRLARLEWTRPGSVWAIDHAQPPLAIAGKYDHLLAVRDLASGQQLGWEPIRQADAATSVEVLARLFAEHGPPLVLKSDNGKALTAGGVPALLAAHEVTPLVSPVYRPQYNGSCEAGVKAMKVRSEDVALIHDRSRHWSTEDLTDALRIANEFHRSSPRSVSRAERWQQRTAIASAERASFLAALAACREQHTTTQAGPLTKQQTRTLERRSLAQALVEQGLLVIHRRPNTSPNKSPEADRIS